ncbi:MAG: hypothetical protein BME93_03990 [Methanosarcinales archaeon Met12]|nr:MAG: hypothetical protein BME93_03990 [Methanosarcinales archaeon Met12]
MFHLPHGAVSRLIIRTTYLAPLDTSYGPTERAYANERRAFLINLYLCYAE